MTERIEFGSKAAADTFRDEHTDHLSSDDDRRLKTVAISSSAPNHAFETATVEASDSQADRDGSGQLPLEDHEIESIDSVSLAWEARCSASDSRRGTYGRGQKTN